MYEKKRERKNPRKHGGRAISIIIDVLQSRLHTLAHTVLAMTAASEHDKFHNVGSRAKWGVEGKEGRRGKKWCFTLSGYYGVATAS